MRRKRQKPKVLPIGSISHGTLRPEDLVPALIDQTCDLRMEAGDRAKIRDCEREWHEWSGPVDSDVDLSETLETLYEVLNNYVPAFCYLGSIEGDGADIGVWPLTDIDQEDDGDIFRGDSHVAALASGKDFWLHVNDHGNMTMYRRVRRGRGAWFVKEWDVV